MAIRSFYLSEKDVKIWDERKQYHNMSQMARDAVLAHNTITMSFDDWLFNKLRIAAEKKGGTIEDVVLNAVLKNLEM